MTRGDVDLTPILSTLPYDDVVVWDGRVRGDAGCFGRWLGLLDCRHGTVYLQDDDVIFTAHGELLDAHDPDAGVITANVPSPWYEACGYDLERSVQVGAGALVEVGTPWPAFQRYLGRWPADRLYLDFCDDVAGILCPSVRVDFGYEVLPVASAPGRISTSPGSAARRRLVAGRCLELRGD